MLSQLEPAFSHVVAMYRPPNDPEGAGGIHTTLLNAVDRSWEEFEEEWL
jgi:hypothetical protein